MDKIKNIGLWCWTKIQAFWTWYKHLYIGRAWYRKAITGIVSFFILLFIYLIMVDINFLWLFGKSPGFAQIMNPTTSQASEIYSADGKLIGKYFNENRTPVKYQDVNPIFWKALIDTEDERFYHHLGIDLQGMLSAAKDAIMRNDARGASTITQQLAKNMFRVRTQYSTGILGKIPGLRILVMKSKEWIIATKLELLYNKEEIITMYANTVDFGSNSYGINTAAKTFFNTTPQKITTEQAAVLVGMLKATSHYNPLLNPNNSLERRNVVLNNMVTAGDLSQTQCDSLCAIPIKLSYSVETNYDGEAKYFREAVADDLKQWCTDNGYDLYNSGLKIYTTIDSRIQKYAEAAVLKQMKFVQQNFKAVWGNKDPWIDDEGNVIPGFVEQVAQRLPLYKALLAKYPNKPDSITYQLNKPHEVKLFDYNGTITKNISTMDSIRYMLKFMHCSFVAMEPQTGAVKAWVGDVDFDTWKYDKVKAERQPGSTFKLFVYTEAMNQGLTPCDKRRDEYISMEVYDKQKHEMTTWRPSNANGSFSGDSIPLKSAFARSINTIAVRLGQGMGIKRVIETAHKMGIKSPLDDTPSLALGASDVNLLEMVNAYSTVANNGKHNEPVLVTKILDKDGNTVYVGSTTEEQVIPYKSAFFMQQLLQSGMREPGGTSQGLWGYVGDFRDTQFGGKTGSTNNYSDAWFMGVSPKLVAGAWVGGEYRSIHFRSGAMGQGSRSALPVCGYFFKALFSDPAFQSYHAKFDKPQDDDIEYGMYNCDSYYPHSKVDTTAVDSLMDEDMEEIVLDANGNPVSRPIETLQGSAVGVSPGQPTPAEATPKKEEKPATRPTRQPVNFDDL